MTSPYKTVGDRVARATEQNFPSQGKYEWVESKSDMYIEKQDLVFGDVFPGEINPITVARSEFINSTSAQHFQEFVVEETTTETYSWSVENALSVNTEFEADVPFVGGTKTSISLSTKSTSTQTETESRSWSYQSTIFVPPHRKIITSFIVNEATYRVPFKAMVTVRGRVYVRSPSANRYVNEQISDLINKLGWHPTTFDVSTNGTMDAVVGQNFIVTADEYELDGTLVAKGRIIARGSWDENGLVVREFQTQPEPKPEPA
ncbi:MAG: ETX/MTX2 family pore-forming toxin [Pelagimonas sp.]|uniref:ETX/MTX2 family pore-forming toxin n=1 Tax=Pelagimonas sp. TaxID=2073170 RepID=UPI003D6AA09B